MQLSLSTASLENFSRLSDFAEDPTANIFPLGPLSPAVSSEETLPHFHDLLSGGPASSKSAPTSSAGTRRPISEIPRRATLADLNPVLSDPAVLGRLVAEQMILPMACTTASPPAIGLPGAADNTAGSENEDGIAESAASFSASIRSSPSHRSVVWAASQSAEILSPAPAVSNFSLSNSRRPLESDGSRVRTDVQGASVSRTESPGFPGDGPEADFVATKFSLSTIQNYGADKLRLSPDAEEITIDLNTPVSRAPHTTNAGFNERTATLFSGATGQIAPTLTAVAAMAGSFSLSDRPANFPPARPDTERTDTLLAGATTQLAPTTTAVAALTGALSLSDRPANFPPARSDTERTATLLSEATTQLAPATTAVVAMTDALSLSDRSANFPSARSDTAATVIAANIAEPLSKYSTIAKSVHKPAALNFLTSDEQLVKNGSDSFGTDVAKPSYIMSEAFTPQRDLSPLEPASAVFAATVVIPHETAVGKVAIPPTEASNIANRAVDAVMTAAERVGSGERTAVNIHFLVSGNELAVRVEYRGGQVHATFTTDSPELRAALSHEWSAAGSNRTGDAPRLATPAFVSTQAGGGNDFSGEGARQQRQSARRDAPENLDFRQSFSSRAAPSASDPHVAPAPQRIVSSSTSNFHTFA